MLKIRHSEDQYDKVANHEAELNAHDEISDPLFRDYEVPVTKKEKKVIEKLPAFKNKLKRDAQKYFQNMRSYIKNLPNIRMLTDQTNAFEAMKNNDITFFNRNYADMVSQLRPIQNPDRFKTMTLPPTIEIEAYQ